MKQSYQQNKYSIAWFKIADFVSRGEKERALGVYRLLSHSIEDSAVVLQLEADILLSCNDEQQALIKYQAAATLYQQVGKLLEALAVYSHLLTLVPHHELFLSKVVALHLLLKNTQFAQQVYEQLFARWIEQKNFASLSICTDEIMQQVQDTHQVLGMIARATAHQIGQDAQGISALVAWAKKLPEQDSLVFLIAKLCEASPQLTAVLDDLSSAP